MLFSATQTKHVVDLEALRLYRPEYQHAPIHNDCTVAPQTQCNLLVRQIPLFEMQDHHILLVVLTNATKWAVSFLLWSFGSPREASNNWNERN